MSDHLTDAPFFVMLTTQGGGYTPLMTEDDELAKFKTKSDAVDSARENILGHNFGYEIFMIGDGICW